MAGLNRTIQVGSSALPPAGHARREELARRADSLAQAAEEAISKTDAQLYSIDPAKLQEEPEILRHYDHSLHMFKVTKAVKGRTYFWERDTADDHSAVARKMSEARMWLGENARGWRVVNGEKDVDSVEYPESRELIQSDGTRRIGDVILMWIPLHEYEIIQKRIMLAARYREANISQKLSDFVREHEGLVKVVSGAADPETIYRESGLGGPHLQHSSRMSQKKTDGIEVAS